MSKIKGSHGRDGVPPTMWTFSRSLLWGPASTSKIRALGSSASRPATTQPDVPPPQTMKSYSSGFVKRPGDIVRHVDGLVFVIAMNTKADSVVDEYPTEKSPTAGLQFQNEQPTHLVVGGP